MHPLHRTYSVGVEAAAIEQALAKAETAVEEGDGLAGTGFWSAVRAIKPDPGLVERYGHRVATIDQAAFAHWAWIRVPLHLGTTLMVLGTAVGLFLIGLAYSLTDMAAVVAFYAGVAVVLTTTHGLGHLVVGTVAGIGFTSWFIASPFRPQPGVKVEYESYLNTPARSRAWMHASGAIVTKSVPFLLIPSAVVAGLPDWAVWGVGVLGIVILVTDIAWSTKSSDWKKFKREMSLAR